MTDSIDRRIVDMQFNNGQFERGIDSTLSSLDQLKKSLNMDGASQGFDSIQKAAEKVDLSGINSGIEAIKVSFSALQVIGITALSELTRGAMEMGRNLLSSVLDPIFEGGKQRALNIEQAKFMFAGLGMDIEASMKSARDAVLGTAYGLDEAAKVASQLGASGMQAGEEMTTALRGIAGTAAMTSSSFSDIGDIFTTVAGNGKLMTMQLRQMSYRGLNASAVLAKSLGKTEAQINKMVTDGKISFAQFSKAMSDAFGEHATSANKMFTGAMSNLRSAFARIGADFYAPFYENMRQVLNALTPVINEIHAGLKPFLEDMGKAMGSSAKFAVGILENLDLTHLPAMFTSISGALQNVIKGLLSVLKPINEAFKAIFPPKGPEGILAFVEGIRVLTERFKIGEETANNIKRTFSGLFAILDIGFMALKGVITVVSSALNLLLNIIAPGAKGILGFAAVLGDFFVALRDGLKSMDAFKVIAEHFAAAFNKVTETIQNVINTFSKSNLNELGEFSTEAERQLAPLTVVANGIAGGFEAIIKVFEYVAPLISRAASFIGSTLVNLGKTLSGAFSSGDFQQVISVINSVLLGGVLFGINNFMDNLSTSVRSIGGFGFKIKDVLYGTRLALEAYQQNLKSKTLFSIAAAVALLAGALLVLSTIDADKMVGSLTAVSVLFADLVVAMQYFALNLKSALSLPVIASGLILFSAAILILSAAMKNLASLSWEEIFKGVSGVAAMSVIMVKVADALVESSPRLIAGSAGLIAFSTAMLILTQSVKQLGELDMIALAKGLGAVGILLYEITLFLKVAKLEKTAFSSALALVALGTSMILFAKAIRDIGSLNLNEIGKGLLGMAGALAIVVEAVSSMPENMISAGLGLIAISAALLILGKALSNMGGMSVKQIAKSLITLNIALLIITDTMEAMEGGLRGAAAMLVMAGAIAVLVPSLMILGSMNLVSIGTALLALAGIFAVLGGASFILAPLTPVILGLAAAIALLGVGVLAIGAGLALFATGLAALAVAGTAGIAVLVGAVSAIINLIPLALQKFGEGVIAFAKVIGEGAPAIIEAIMTLILTLIDTIVEHVPEIAEAGMKLLIGLLEGIAKNIQDITVLGLKIIEEFLFGVAKGVPGVVSAAVDVVVAFIDSVGKETPRIVDAGFQMIIDFLNGIADAIRKNTQPLIDAADNISDAIVEGIATGLGSRVGRVVKSAKNLGSSILTAFNTELEIQSPSKKMKKSAEEIVNGLIEGMKSTDPERAAENLAKDIEKGFVGGKSAFKGVGATSATEFLKGLSDKEIEAKAIGEIIALAAQKGIEVNEKELKKSGEKAGQAYIDGLNAKSQKGINYVVNGMLIALQSTEPVTIAKNLAKAISEGLSSNDLTGIGATEATEFLKGLSDKEIEAKAVAEMVALATKAGIEFNIEDFEKAGFNAGQAYIDGLNSQLDAAKALAQKIADIASGGGYSSQFKKETADRASGAAMGTDILSTLTDEQAATYWGAGGGAAGTAAVDAAFKTGENAGKAFASGVSSTTSTVQKAVTGQAYLAKRAAEKALGIKSPSTVFMGIGKFAGLGFVEGLNYMASEVSNTAGNLGSTAVDGLKNAISKIAEVASTDVDYEPVIRPVIDLNEIQNGVDKISQMFANTNDLTIKAASEIDKSRNPKRNDEINNPTIGESKGDVIFQQFNNSPKALNRTEIYRQTNNLVSTMKRGVQPG